MSDRPTFMERNVVQWVLGYLVAAWGCLEALGFLAELFGWSESIVRAAVVLLAAGGLAVLTLAWNHGARGLQRFTRIEGALLAVIALGGVLGVVLIAPGGSIIDTESDLPEVESTRIALAVLPPADLSRDPQAPFFLAGMHDGLIRQIAQVSGFRVISRTSSARYADQSRPLGEIAAELGVDDVVETTLSRSADTVRMGVRLVQVLPEEELRWFGEFSAPVEEVVRLQAEVARTLARETRTEMDPDEQERLLNAPVVDPATYRDYLRGMYAIMEGTPERIAEGIATLEAAVARDPADPWAYAGLAMGLTTLGHSPFSQGDTWPRAQEAAERAVALAPDLAEAHAALAETRLYWERDWDGAERAFRRANQLNPNLAMNRYHYAWFLNLFDRNEEALVHHLMARQLDPLTPLHTSWLAQIYLDMEPPRPGPALEAIDDGLAIPGGGPVPLVVQGLIYGQLGRYDESAAVLESLAETLPPVQWMLGVTYARAGRMDEARSIRDRLEAGDPIPFEAYGLVHLNTLLGDLDRAFEWMYDRPAHGWLPWLRTADWLGALHADPRFDRFLAEMGLPPVRSTGPAIAVTADQTDG